MDAANKTNAVNDIVGGNPTEATGATADIKPTVYVVAPSAGNLPADQPAPSTSAESGRAQYDQNIIDAILRAVSLLS